MDEIQEAAIGYFNNSSTAIQQNACDFFTALDTNRDGKISLAEFVSFLSQQGHGWIDHNLFTQLDQNRDGSLNFQEVLALYYIIKTRKVFCATCRSNLFGLYFTCTTCFDHNMNSFNLCLRCYKQREFIHDHDRFLDSYVLLRTRTGPCAMAAMAEVYGTVIGEIVQPNNSQAFVPYQPSQQYYPQHYQMPLQPINIQPQVPYEAQTQTPNHQQIQALDQYPYRPHAIISWHNAFRLMELGIATSSLASACTIM